MVYIYIYSVRFSIQECQKKRRRKWKNRPTERTNDNDVLLLQLFSENKTKINLRVCGNMAQSKNASLNAK